MREITEALRQQMAAELPEMAEIADADLRAKLLHACELEGRDPATVRIVTGAPIDAPPEHLALLGDAGVDDVDLMLTKPEHLDMQFAAEVGQTVLGAFE